MAGKEDERGLPREFAHGLQYFREYLVTNEPWLNEFEGKYVAIHGVMVDDDKDPNILAAKVKRHFPNSVLYMPHVVKLPTPPEVPGLELPLEWREGSEYYKQVLRSDADWVKSHLSSWAAIIGQQVVENAPTFHQLSTQVRNVYGYGPIFMTHVTEEYPPVIRLRPRMLTK